MYNDINTGFTPEQTPLSQAVHLSDYLNTVWKHKWLIIIILMVVVTIVSIKTFTTTPIYKATVKIMFEGESDFAGIKEIDVMNRKEKGYHETQYELLRSKSLVSELLEDSQLRENLASNRPKPDYLMVAFNKFKNYFASNNQQKPKSNTTTISKSLEGQSKHAPPKKFDPLVGYYLSNLKVEPLSDTHLVNISFLNPSPEVAALVANAHALTYIKKSNQLQQLASKQALNWLKENIREQKVAVNSSNNLIEKFKYEQLKTFSINDESIYMLPEVMSNTAIQKLRDQLSNLKSRKVELATKFGQKYPKIVEINSSIVLIEQQIEEEIQRIKERIEIRLGWNEASEKNIQQQKDVQYQTGDSSIIKDANFNLLQLEAVSDQDIYDILLKQAKEISLTENLNNNIIRIIDEAVAPFRPISPKIFFNILLSVVLGLTFGIGIAFFVEYMDKTIRTPETIMKQLGMSVIGVLPYEKSLKGNKMLPLKSNLLSNEYSKTHNKRINNYYNYRISNSLVSSLPIQPFRTSGQIFLVESANSGEGKTTVLAKSAVSLARTGLRVAMVDADMLQPSLHLMFGMENNNGKCGLLNSMANIMSLKIQKGKLDKYTMDDLFFLIALRRQSGKLIVTDDSQSQMTVFFENGRFFYIQGHDTPFDNRLGTMLLRGDFITESQLKEALDRNKRTGQPLGYILVNAGYINQTKLQGPLKLQMEEHLQKLFSWKYGKFVFEPSNIETYEDKRIFFQEDYSPIIDRLGRMVGNQLLEREVLSCVKPVNEPNLSLITAGIGNANNVGPLFYALLSKYLVLLKQHYDVILIDAPPLLETMGSSKSLISLADGIIFVVKSGHASLREIKESLEYMKEGKNKIIGTVLNQVKKDFGYYSNYNQS